MNVNGRGLSGPTVRGGFVSFVRKLVLGSQIFKLDIERGRSID